MRMVAFILAILKTVNFMEKGRSSFKMEMFLGEYGKMVIVSS
jgi:hypothetical protein